jgi:arylsulfatase A-like enzyme
MPRGGAPTRIMKFTRLLILLAIMTGWPAGGSQPAQPNLVIVLVDTLRADHLAAYGCERDVSPHVTRLAGKSLLFVNHYSHASRTGPSVASLLTGLHPPSHGVINPLSHREAKGTLREECTTLAEILAAAGYDCFGVIANFNVSARFGFGQGYSTYQFIRSTSAADVNQAVFQRLRARSARPFFLYLHYMEPHSPYEAPPPYRSLYVDPTYSGQFDGRQSQLYQAVAGKTTASQADASHLRALYDQEITYFDDEFGRLLDFLASENLAGETIIVFVADHGEEFLDHGSFLHGYTLYEEQIHVPLFIFDPRQPRPRRIESITRHVDVLPTLLTMLGVDYEGVVQGCDLIPQINGRPPVRPAPVYALTQLRSAKTVQMQSLLQDGWKLIATQLPAAGEQLFHLVEDPAEQKNLIESEPEVADSMRVRLAEFVASLPVADSDMVELTPEEIRTLRSLGYIK